MEKASDQTFTFNDLTIARFVVNSLRENTYIVFNRRGDGIVIDCGVRRESEQSCFATFVSDHHITLRAHLLTHSHFDHLWGSQWLYDTYHLLPVIPPREVANYHRAEASAHKIFHRPVAVPLPPEPLINDGTPHLTFTHLCTPGHTRGSYCFYSPRAGILFSGDTIFKDYIGIAKEEVPLNRIQQSLKEKIYTLPPQTLVFPGHGPEFVLQDQLPR